MNEEQLKIWFAGFYEGEGTISNDKTNRNRLKVSISQNDRTPLDIGKARWGGHIRERTRKSPASDKICHGHEWQMSHSLAVHFLQDIKPYMLIPYKIQQIEFCEENLNKEWNRKFKCTFCEKEFSDMSGKTRHEKNNHTTLKRLHTCEICNNKYSSLDSMKRHKKQKHETNIIINSVASV